MTPAISSGARVVRLRKFLFGLTDVRGTGGAGGAVCARSWGGRLLHKQPNSQQSSHEQHRRLLWKLLDTVAQDLAFLSLMPRPAARHTSRAAASSDLDAAARQRAHTLQRRAKRQMLGRRRLVLFPRLQEVRRCRTRRWREGFARDSARQEAPPLLARRPAPA